MGIPMGLQYSITAIGSVVIQTAINGLGSTAVASVAAAQKVSMLFCCPFDALGGTMATYAGQNIGARKLERVTRGVHAADAIGIIYALGAFAVTFSLANRSRGCLWMPQRPRLSIRLTSTC